MEKRLFDQTMPTLVLDLERSSMFCYLSLAERKEGAILFGCFAGESEGRAAWYVNIDIDSDSEPFQQLPWKRT